jgi:hypothetical protein
MTAATDFGERAKKSFDFLQDTTKQVIALATAILTFTLTFLKDVAKGAGQTSYTIMTVAWALLVVSALLGFLVLFNMTGVLDPANAEPPTIYKSSIRLFSGLQQLLFVVALLALLLFAITWYQPPA